LFWDLFCRIWKICSNTIPIYRPNSCRLVIRLCTNWYNGPNVCHFILNSQSKWVRFTITLQHITQLSHIRHLVTTNFDLLQVHTRLLTHKWHELLVLTTSAYQAIHGPQKIWNSTNINGDRNDDSEFNQEVRWTQYSSDFVWLQNRTIWTNNRKKNDLLILSLFCVYTKKNSPS